MSNAKTRNVLCPERLKMNCLTDFAAAVHLGREAVQLRKLQLRGSGGIRDWDFKLEVKLVTNLVIVIPAGTSPSRARLVAFDVEPILVLLLIKLDVL